MHRKIRIGAPIAILGFVALQLTGCSSIPTSGPSASDVVEQGAPQDSQYYEFVDLTPAVIDKIGNRGYDTFAGRFGDHRGSVEPRIEVGDVVSVTIWEAAAGGLFSAPIVSDKLSSGSNSATIPEQVVGRDGAITVPYAGRVQVAGHTTRDVQLVIQKSLEGKAIQPQVLVNVPRSVSNTVTVGGEVTQSARVPLSVKGDRLLDVIATAGGIRAPANEIYVELSRGSTTARVALNRVITDPRENIYMRPNDVVTLVRDPQTFIAYGAMGRNDEIPFAADGISLAQALAKSGGLQDSRSDPKGVFIFRYETAAVARALKPDSALISRGSQVPVVYRLDLRDPNSLFVQQKFRIANRDVIYVSNAPLTEVEKVIGIFNTVISPAGSAAGVASAASSVR